MRHLIVDGGIHRLGQVLHVLRHGLIILIDGLVGIRPGIKLGVAIPQRATFRDAIRRPNMFAGKGVCQRQSFGGRRRLRIQRGFHGKRGCARKRKEQRQTQRSRSFHGKRSFA